MCEHLAQCCCAARLNRYWCFEHQCLALRGPCIRLGELDQQLGGADLHTVAGGQRCLRDFFVIYERAIAAVGIRDQPTPSFVADNGMRPRTQGVRKEYLASITAANTGRLRRVKLIELLRRGPFDHRCNRFHQLTPQTLSVHEVYFF